MKKRLIAGLLALMALGLTFGSTFAGSPGDHPINGILLTDGLATTIPANSTLWFFVPYPMGYQVEIGLNPQSLGGVGFDVFTLNQATAWLANPQTNPMGRGALNTKSGNNLTWSGRLAEGGNLYVLLKNTNPFPANVIWSYRAWVFGWIPLRGQLMVRYFRTNNYVPYDLSTSTPLHFGDIVRLDIVQGTWPDTTYTTRVIYPTATFFTQVCDGSPCLVYPIPFRTPQGPPDLILPSFFTPNGTYTFQDLFRGQVQVQNNFVVAQ
jgi:hypothetical protein